MSTRETGKDLRTTCPFCLLAVRVYLDCKDRPYWRCWRCEVRCFGTKTAFASLKTDGWIWEHEPPINVRQNWLKRITRVLASHEEKPE